MRSFFTRHIRALAPTFRPPFDGLWLAALLYFFWCFLVYPKSQLLRGNLPDPDDYMYLNQVLDWLNGQGWFDSVQHRIAPPLGGPIHFSRIAEIPMAMMIWLFERCGLPPIGAATIMAIIEPLFLLAGFFFAIRWVAEVFVPKNWGGASAYVTLFATGLMAMFTPGHIDHHGLVVLLVALALGCALRMMKEPELLAWAFGMGFALALSLTVALETLPWLILMSGWMGLWAIIKGRAAARSGLVYGLTLYGVSAVLLLLTQEPAALLMPDMTVYSIVYVFFTGSIAAIFAGIGLVADRSMAWRWLLGVALTATTGILFLAQFPELVKGPMGGINPALAHLIVENITEAEPLVTFKGSWLKAMLSLLEPLTAFAAVVYFLKSARADRRWPWSLMALLGAAAFLLTAFYQYRFVGALGLFAIVPLTVLLQRGWLWIRHNLQGRTKMLAELGLLLLVGPLPAVLIPATIDGRSFNKGVLLFPVHNDDGGVCDMYGLEKVLSSPQLYGGIPRVIMNTMGLGPELLFRTPHKVLSAPFHEVVAGNLDAVRFFSTVDEGRAEAIARRWHADLVVACKLVPGMYTDLAAIKHVLPDMAEPKPKTADDTQAPPMILRLITGQNLPNWLVPVTSPVLSNYVVYEIVPPSTRLQKYPSGG